VTTCSCTWSGEGNDKLVPGRDMPGSAGWFVVEGTPETQLAVSDLNCFWGSRMGMDYGLVEVRSDSGDLYEYQEGRAH